MTRTLFYACILSMIMSCSGSSSSSSDVASEIIDSIPIHQVDDKVKVLEVLDLGNLPVGKEVRRGTAIWNSDSVRGVRIVGIDGDYLVSKCNPSLDTILPQMLIGVDFILKVPEEKGPFDASMSIHYKNVKNPSIIRLHGNAE